MNPILQQFRRLGVHNFFGWTSCKRYATHLHVISHISHFSEVQKLMLNYITSLNSLHIDVCVALQHNLLHHRVSLKKIEIPFTAQILSFHFYSLSIKVLPIICLTLVTNITEIITENISFCSKFYKN